MITEKLGVKRVRDLQVNMPNHEAFFQFARNSAKPISSGTGNRLRQVKESNVFALAEVLRLEEFRKTNDLRTLLSRDANVRDGGLHVLFRVGVAGHLNQSHTKLLWRQGKASVAEIRLQDSRAFGKEFADGVLSQTSGCWSHGAK